MVTTTGRFSRTRLLFALLASACTDSPMEMVDRSDPPVPVAAVEIAAPATLLERGGTMKLAATARDATGAALAGRVALWSSSAPHVASIDGSGLVRGLGAGEATISVLVDGRSASVALAVRDTAALPTSLDGVFERVNLTLPAGSTYRVTGDLTVIVDSAFTIDADLVMSPGVSLALYGGRLLRIRGNIVMDSVAGAGEPSHSVSALASTRAGETEIVLGGENAIELIGSEQGGRRGVTPRGPIYIAGEGDLPSLTLSYAIVQPIRARSGTRSSRRGDDGYPVHIGSLAAQKKAEEKFGRPHSQFQKIVVRRSTIGGGDAGRGYSILSRQDGFVQAHRWEGTAGDGGTGGPLVIRAGDLDVRESAIMQGLGGEGGAIILGPTDAIRDGTGPNGEGESFHGVTGSGGASGELNVIVQYVVAAEHFWAISGASPGHGLVQGGNGQNGGKGGDLTFAIGDPGPPGRITVPASLKIVDPGKARRIRVTVRDAANGADAPGMQQEGGRGGTIAVLARGLEGPAYVDTVYFVRSGNGGHGFDGCKSMPRTNGSRGGNGGVRRTKGGQANDDGSFAGGRGGDGVKVAGPGGDPGSDDAGKPIGRRGSNGVLCPPKEVGASGTVFHGSKALLARVEFRSNSQTSVANIDALGNFRIDLPAGSYVASVVGQPAWVQCPSHQVDLTDGPVTLSFICSTIPFVAEIDASYRHLTGYSAVCLVAFASPNLAGAPWELHVTGTGVLGTGKLQGVVDASGRVQGRVDIGAYGTYTFSLTIADRSFTTTISVGQPAGSCTL